MTTVSPDLELAPPFRLAVPRLARRLRQESGEGLTPSQNSALASIERHGGLTPSELATIERIQQPTVTRVLAGLSERNLVTREADPSDLRNARLKVPPDGA